VTEGDAALEDIGVVRRVGLRRFGLGQVEQVAQLGDEKLVVGALRSAGGLPAGDEVFDGVGDGGHRAGHKVTGGNASARFTLLTKSRSKNTFMESV
jgi:hypothetical protein